MPPTSQGWTSLATVPSTPQWTVCSATLSQNPHLKMACQEFCHSNQKNNCPRWAHWLYTVILHNPPSAGRSSGYWAASSVCTFSSCWTEYEDSSKDFQTEASVSTLGELRCLRRGRKPFIISSAANQPAVQWPRLLCSAVDPVFFSQILVWVFFPFYWITSSH